MDFCKTFLGKLLDNVVMFCVLSSLFVRLCTGLVGFWWARWWFGSSGVLGNVNATITATEF